MMSGLKALGEKVRWLASVTAVTFFGLYVPILIRSPTANVDVKAVGPAPRYAVTVVPDVVACPGPSAADDPAVQAVSAVSNAVSIRIGRAHV